MSTIKVTNLQNASAASPAIVLDANSRATLNGLSYPTEGSLSGRNRIINGSMTVDQRNAGASVTPPNANSTYSVDRWACFEDTDGSVSLQQTTDGPAGFSNSLRVTVSTTDTSLASTQRCIVYQSMEGYNVDDLSFGTASAKQLTVSFWVKSSLTGSFGGAVTNGNNRSYPFAYSISAASTWEYKTVTLSADTTGTWNKTTGVGATIIFSLGSGSSYVGTANTWAAADLMAPSGTVNVMATASATWQITGVQLEAGTIATAFERRPYGQELALCQRYFQKFNAGFEAYSANATSNNSQRTSFITPMRVIPTLTENFIAGSNVQTCLLENFDANGFWLKLVATNSGYFYRQTTISATAEL